MKLNLRKKIAFYICDSESVLNRMKCRYYKEESAHDFEYRFFDIESSRCGFQKEPHG